MHALYSINHLNWNSFKWSQLIFNFLTVWFAPPSDRFNRSVPDVCPSISTNHFINWLLDFLMTRGDTTKIEYMPYRQHWLRYFPVTSVILPEATENWIVVINQEKISQEKLGWNRLNTGTNSVTQKLVTRYQLTVATELYSINYSTWSKFY